MRGRFRSPAFAETFCFGSDNGNPRIRQTKTDDSAKAALSRMLHTSGKGQKQPSALASSHGSFVPSTVQDVRVVIRGDFSFELQRPLCPLCCRSEFVGLTGPDPTD